MNERLDCWRKISSTREFRELDVGCWRRDLDQFHGGKEIQMECTGAVIVAEEAMNTMDERYDSCRRNRQRQKVRSWIFKQESRLIQ